MNKYFCGIMLTFSLSSFALAGEADLKNFIRDNLSSLKIRIDEETLKCISGWGSTGTCIANGDFMSPNSSSSIAFIVYKKEFENEKLELEVKALDGEF